jgi:hypothetical protein
MTDISSSGYKGIVAPVAHRRYSLMMDISAHHDAKRTEATTLPILP